MTFPPLNHHLGVLARLATILGTFQNCHWLFILLSIRCHKAEIANETGRPGYCLAASQRWHQWIWLHWPLSQLWFLCEPPLNFWSIIWPKLCNLLAILEAPIEHVQWVEALLVIPSRLTHLHLHSAQFLNQLGRILRQTSLWLPEISRIRSTLRQSDLVDPLEIK